MLILKNHKYAPELNTIHINSANIKAPNVKTYKQAKQFLGYGTFKNETIKHTSITVSSTFGNKTYKGQFRSYKELKRFLKSVIKKHSFSANETINNSSFKSEVLTLEIKTIKV